MRWAAGRSQWLATGCSHSRRRLSTGDRRLGPARIRRPSAVYGHFLLAARESKSPPRGSMMILQAGFPKQGSEDQDRRRLPRPASVCCLEPHTVEETDKRRSLLRGKISGSSPVLCPSAGVAGREQEDAQSEKELVHQANRPRVRCRRVRRPC